MTINKLFDNALTRCFREHLEETDVHQTYLEHGKFAIYNSFRLIVGGLKGIVHGVYPPAFKFDTSTEIIHIFKELADSGRHKNEIREILGEGCVSPEYIKRTGERGT